MEIAQKPENEEKRLASLRRYKILDTPPEQCFDDITALASSICETPIALMSLMDQDRQWFKSAVGVNYRQTSRDASFCAHGILTKELFVVPDAAKDSRFAGNPVVKSNLHIRFYAGIPLISSDGYPLGMLCVKDTKPRTLTSRQTAALKMLGRQVMSQLELRTYIEEHDKMHGLLAPVFRTLFESAPGVYVALIPDLRIVAVSDDFLAATKTKRATIIGHELFQVFPDNPDDPKATGVANLRVSYEKVFRTKKSDTMAIQKYDIRRPESEGSGFEERYWVAVNSPLLDPNNDVAYIITRSEDVTDVVRLRQEEVDNHKKESDAGDRLKEALAQLEGQQKALNQFAIVAETNAAGLITYVNDLFCTISKYSRDELLGKDHREVVNSGFHPKSFWKDMWSTIEQGRIWRGDVKNKAKDGAIYWVDTTIVPFLDSTGKPYKYLAIRAVITDRKLAEAKLKEVMLDLEERVLNRTADLSAATNEIEAFSYSMAHDLRTPLRGISGYAQILLEECQNKLDVREKDYLQRICLASQYMGQLIDDLLSLSGLTQKNMRVNNINLTLLATDIATELKDNQPERQVRFVIAPHMETIGDKNLLRIVLTNLINNAWKFTSKCPSPLIEVGIKKTLPDTIFFIRDDGAGFDMAYSKNLFGVFKRLHRNDEFPGTGIGLAMAQRIIRLHGGSIWANGEVEHGATFYFTLAPPANRDL